MENESALARSVAITSEKVGEEQIPFASSIAYLGELNKAKCPYSLYVNPNRLSQLLKKEFHFSQNQLDKVRVYVIGERQPKRPHKFTKEQRKFFFDKDIYKPSYAGIKEDDDGIQHIIIYAFEAWKDVNSDKKLMITQAKRKNKTDKSWETLEAKTKLFKTEGRMKRYLNIAPVERVNDFLDRLVAIKARNLIRESIIHEVSHAREYGTTFDAALKKLKKMGLVQWFLEQMAEREEEKTASKSKWFDVVDFRVNKPLPDLPIVAQEPSVAA